jgi:hypothetical protein
MVRPDDGPIGLKHVALNVLLIATKDALDENINTLYKIWKTSRQIKLSQYSANLVYDVTYFNRQIATFLRNLVFPSLV